MALDRDEFEALLDQARAHAELAVSQADPLHYRDAFEASLKAMRLLAEESGAWRQMVARATEEFEPLVVGIALGPARRTRARMGERAAQQRHVGKRQSGDRLGRFGQRSILLRGRCHQNMTVAT